LLVALVRGLGGFPIQGSLRQDVHAAEHDAASKLQASPKTVQSSMALYTRRPAETRMPRIGNTVGARKCSCSTSSFRSTSTALFTMMKARRSRTTVVVERVSMLQD